MEKTICPLPCLKFVLNSIKTVCTSETADMGVGRGGGKAPPGFWNY